MFRSIGTRTGRGGSVSGIGNRTRVQIEASRAKHRWRGNVAGNMVKPAEGEFPAPSESPRCKGSCLT